VYKIRRLEIGKSPFEEGVRHPEEGVFAPSRCGGDLRKRGLDILNEFTSREMGTFLSGKSLFLHRTEKKKCHGYQLAGKKERTLTVKE